MDNEKNWRITTKTKKVKQIEKTHLISDDKVRLKSKQFQIANGISPITNL